MIAINTNIVVFLTAKPLISLYTQRGWKTSKLNNSVAFVGIKADSRIACHAHAVPLPCRAAKGLELVFPIWFTQCGRVWFTLAMIRPCRSSQGQSTARPSLDGRAVLWPWEERYGRSMASVNQTRPHCVNQMRKTHSKPLVARHGRGKAWARHGHGMLRVNRSLVVARISTSDTNYYFLGKWKFIFNKKIHD